MSEITSRPEVHAVSTEAVAAASVAAGIGVLIMAGKALYDLVAQESPSLATRVNDQGGAAPRELASVRCSRRAQLAAERRTLAAAIDHMPALEAHKVATLAGLDAAGCAVNPEAIREPLRAVVQAPSLAAAERARAALVEAVQVQHMKTLVATVTAACQQASAELGFREVVVEPRGDGRFARVVATTPAGRALVSEVRAEGDGLSVETEVLGVHDGSCHGVLDAFDEALERRGITGDKARRFTGGVCELASAREVMPRLARPRASATGSSSATAPAGPVRRQSRPARGRQGR